ncbi:hypothetical protein G7054_g13159 [Neopestalotiopsis clavispora]|nr:hypothetical protein G7054_g13159 [Neopestalotiopsis clavispora]
MEAAGGSAFSGFQLSVDPDTLLNDRWLPRHQITMELAQILNSGIPKITVDIITVNRKICAHEAHVDSGACPGESCKRDILSGVNMTLRMTLDANYSFPVIMETWGTILNLEFALKCGAFSAFPIRGHGPQGESIFGPEVTKRMETPVSGTHKTILVPGKPEIIEPYVSLELMTTIAPGELTPFQPGQPFVLTPMPTWTCCQQWWWTRPTAWGPDGMPTAMAGTEGVGVIQFTVGNHMFMAIDTVEN